MKNKQFPSVIGNYKFVVIFQWLSLVLLSQTALKTILSNIDADFLYISLFARDLVLAHDLVGWKVTPSPYFFPDILIHTAAELFENFSIGVIFYYVFSLFSVIYAAHLIFQSQGFERKHTYLTACSIGVLIVLNLVLEIHPKFSTWILRAGMHGSASILGLLGLGIIMRSINNNKLAGFRLPRIAFGVSVMISDLLFVNQFLIPGMLSGLLVSAFAKGRRKFFLTISLELLLILSSGYFLKEWLKLFVNFDFTLLGQTTQLPFFISYERLMSNLQDLNANLNILTILIGIGLVVLLFGFFFQLIQIIRNSKTNRGEFAKLFFFTFAVASILGSVLPTLLFGYYMDFNSLRYLLPVFLFSLLAIGLMVLALSSYFRANVCIIFAVFCLVLAFSTAPLEEIEANTTILSAEAPDSIQCLENLSSQNHWKKGLSDYWMAKPIIYWSKNRLAMGQVRESLEIYYWISRLDDFFRNSDSGEPLSFDFIVMNNLNSYGTFRILGSKPKKTYTCRDMVIWELTSEQGLLVGNHIRNQLRSKYSKYLAKRPELFSNWLF